MSRCCVLVKADIVEDVLFTRIQCFLVLVNLHACYLKISCHNNLSINRNSVSKGDTLKPEVNKILG